jgi:hypothetical protein
MMRPTTAPLDITESYIVVVLVPMIRTTALACRYKTNFDTFCRGDPAVVDAVTGIGIKTYLLCTNLGV